MVSPGCRETARHLRKAYDMGDVSFGILVFCLVLFAALQERISFRLISGENRKMHVVLILSGMFNIIWLVWAIIIGISILSFLTGVYVSFFLSILPLHRENSVRIRFCQMKFVVFTAVTLIFLGVACLFGNDVQQVSHIREVRLFVLTGAKAAEMAYIMLHEKYFVEDFESQEPDKKKIGLFQGFLICCLAYIYADGILAIFDFGGDFVPALMISGNILILILMFLFYRFDYVMEQKEHLEREHQLLVEEKARELWKAEMLKSMAEKDALTNAYSRRYVIENTGLLKENNVPFLIVYIDMDRMKEINDTRGHQAGDIYLKNFVNSFSNKLRKDDYIARVGGDEFIVVLKRCSAEDGKKRMEEISMLLPEYSFSYGIASGDYDVEAMIEEADQCMYNFKRQKSRGTGGV